MATAVSLGVLKKQVFARRVIIRHDDYVNGIHCFGEIWFDRYIPVPYGDEVHQRCVFMDGTLYIYPSGFCTFTSLEMNMVLSLITTSGAKIESGFVRDSRRFFNKLAVGVREGSWCLEMSE